MERAKDMKADVSLERKSEESRESLDVRERRRAQALRENLLRRKQQKRAKQESPAL